MGVDFITVAVRLQFRLLVTTISPADSVAMRKVYISIQATANQMAQETAGYQTRIKEKPKR